MKSWILPAMMMAASPAMADIAYVSNEKDDTLTLIDTDALEVLQTIDVGMRPRGIIFSHDYKYLYICASDSDAVQVLDVATNKIIHNLPSGEDPEQFALHPNNHHLYIANEDDAVVTVVDTEKRDVVAQINVGVEPEGMAASPDGKWVINTSETTNMLHWIDASTQELVDNTLVDQRPRHVEFTKDGKTVWSSSEIGGTVSIVDVASKAITHTINFKIPGVHRDKIQPVGVKLTDNGKYAFVALGPANHVAVVDAKTYEVLDYLLVGRRVWMLEFANDQKLLLTTNGVSGDVSVIDTVTLGVWR